MSLAVLYCGLLLPVLAEAPAVFTAQPELRVPLPAEASEASALAVWTTPDRPDLARMLLPCGAEGLIVCDFTGETVQKAPGGEPVLAMAPFQQGPERAAAFIADAKPPRIRFHRMSTAAGRLNGLLARPAMLDAPPAAWAASPRGGGRALLWVALTDGRLLRFAMDAAGVPVLTLERTQKLPWKVSALAASPGGEVYAAREDGSLWRRAPGQEAFKRFAEPGPRGPMAPPVAAQVWAPAADGDLVLAASAGAPICAVFRLGEQARHIATFRVQGMYSGFAGAALAEGALPPCAGDRALLLLDARRSAVAVIPWERLARHWIERNEAS